LTEDWPPTIVKIRLGDKSSFNSFSMFKHVCR
jgi:hypothetical protein